MSNQNTDNELRANPPALLKVPEAAKVLGVSIRTMQRLIAEEKIPVCRFGRRVILKREDVFDYANNCRVEAAI